jgi:hypothetical protein
MAYTHSKYEVEMNTPILGPSTVATPTAIAHGLRLDVTGIAGQWGPGFVPHIIRGAAVVPLTPTTNHTDDVFVRFDADISTVGTATTAFTINLPTTAGGRSGYSVYYTPTYEIIINPGSQMTANVTAAATAGVYAKVVLYVEPKWETPANVTSMTQTT